MRGIPSNYRYTTNDQIRCHPCSRYICATCAEPSALLQFLALHTEVVTIGAFNLPLISSWRLWWFGGYHKHSSVTLAMGAAASREGTRGGGKASGTQIKSNFLNSLININTVLVYGGINYVGTVPHGLKNHCQIKATNSLIFHLGQHWPI